MEVFVARSLRVPRWGVFSHTFSASEIFTLSPADAGRNARLAGYFARAGDGFEVRTSGGCHLLTFFF